jgi:exportin-1
LTEGVLKKRWKTLPREQCEGIINHIVRLIIQISSKGDCVQQEKVLLKKLNIALVLLLAREWPKHWSIFISEIVGASIGNENICENSMHILKLLSEEVLNFPTGDMTKIKAKHLKDFLCSEFFPVFELWQFVLVNMNYHF